MGQEQYFSTVQEADQFLEDLVLEIFRFEIGENRNVKLPVFICFDFMVTEALMIIGQALSMSEKGLHLDSVFHSLVVREYLKSLRPTLGDYILDENVQTPYFREDFAWRNESIKMLEELLSKS